MWDELNDTTITYLFRFCAKMFTILINLGKVADKDIKNVVENRW